MRDPHDHQGVLVDACRLTLHGTLEVVARSRGRHVFVQTEGRSISYAELHDQSRRLATGWARTDTSARSPVVLLSADPVVTAVSWLAASRLGRPLVPLNPALSSPALARTLAGLDAQIVVADAELIPAVRGVAALEPSLKVAVVDGPVDAAGGIDDLAMSSFSSALDHDHPERRGGEGGPRWDEAALILGTSGSTGPPKRSVLSHGYCLHAASEFASGRGATAEATFYCPLPLFHVNALLTTLLAAMVVGATSAHDPKFSARSFWDRTRLFGATHVSLIGSMIPRLHSLAERDDDRHHPVETVLTSPARPAMSTAFMERFGVELVFAYGQTEATPVIGPGAASGLPPGSTGRRNPAFEIDLQHEDGTSVEAGDTGEIVFRPRSEGVTFSGYLDDPASTAARRRGDWHRTGDLARLVDGDAYVYVGRRGDVMRRAGENISAVEVEAALLAVSGIAEVAVHQVPGELDDEIKAWVVCAPGAAVTVEAVVAAAQALPPFARPRYLEFTDALPRTPSDHLRRSDLAGRGSSEATIDLGEGTRRRPTVD